MPLSRITPPSCLMRTLVTMLLVCMASAVQADVLVPALHSRVTDLTATLSADQVNALEMKLTAFEQAKGSQIAVLILPTTEPETIEQFGIKVAEQWKIGRKGVDDGAILIVAKDDRRLRIEVGYGLEGALNDATAKRIIDETITPQFKAGNFAGGIDAGLQQMMGVVNGETLPPPAASEWQQQAPLPVPGWLIPLLLFVVVAGRVLKLVFGALRSSGITFFVVAAIVLLIGWPVVAAAILGVVAMLFAVGPMMGGGGFVSGGGGGGSGRSGGGFSGGGGSFGGGGASGGW